MKKELENYLKEIIYPAFPVAIQKLRICPKVVPRNNMVDSSTISVMMSLPKYKNLQKRKDLLYKEP